MLIELYAPYDDGCRKLAPAFASLAARTKGVAGLTIAAMDVTGNDPPPVRPAAHIQSGLAFVARGCFLFKHQPRSDGRR